MTWAEKIIALRPITVTGAYLLTVAIAALTTEIFPIGSTLAWIAFGIAALAASSFMFVWLRALSDVAHLRLGSPPAEVNVARTRFVSAGFWLLAWCVLVAVFPLMANSGFFVLTIIPNLLFAYFWLRINWETAKALLRFEGHAESSAFWTFIQIVYFPIGVWFLQPRFRNLLSAPPQNLGSVA